MRLIAAMFARVGFRKVLGLQLKNTLSSGGQEIGRRRTGSVSQGLPICLRVRHLGHRSHVEGKLKVLGAASLAADEEARRFALPRARHS